MPDHFCLCSGVNICLFCREGLLLRILTLILWGQREAETTWNNRILNCLILALSVSPKAGQSLWKINLEASSTTSEEVYMFLGIQGMSPAVVACGQLRRWPSPYLWRAGLSVHSRRASQNWFPDVWLWMLLCLLYYWRCPMS